MQTELQKKCDLLTENYDRMSKGNKLEFNTMIAAGAAMFAAADAEADTERVKECRKLLKEKKGIFSNFRGTAEFIIRCKMALSKDPEAYLARLDSVYSELANFLSTGQTLLAAMVIAEFAAPEEQSAVVEKTKTIFKEMEKTHPWLTNQDDMPFAALMTATGKDAVSVYEEAESNYEILKQELDATPNTRQMLSHILALYPGHAEIKCDRVCRLAAGLKEAKHALSGDRYMAILGMMAGSTVPVDELVRAIGEADDYLKQHEGFHGLFGIGPNVRRMLAVQMVAAAQEKSGTADAMGGAAVSTAISSSIEVAIITLMVLYTMITISATTGSHS